MQSTDDTNKLIEALLTLETKSECKQFLRDLLTEQEISDFALRWKVARELSAGTTYTEIEAQTGLSSATIARISKWLNSGAGGYKLVLKKLKLA